MAVTIAPSVEAMQAIVARVNTGTLYSLDLTAVYTDEAIDPLEEITRLRVDVASDTEEQLEETLDLEDRTSHQINVWVRAKVRNTLPASIDPLKLIVRQIYQRLNDYDTADLRVKVWQAQILGGQIPDKAILRQSLLFVAAIGLRVEVEAS